MGKQSNLARSRSGANLHDVAVLAAFFSLGVASLTFIKISLGSNLLGNLLAILATGSSIVAYAIAAYLSNRTKIEPETIGDNCYYLGFLFTLSSLSIALFQISGLDGEVESYRQLISGFGIALSSTIIGVLLRVIFLQGRHDLVARERESRLALNEATSQFRGVLSQSIAELKQFSIETAQVSKETLDAVTEVAKEARNEHRKSIEEETKKSLDTIGTKLTATNEIISSRVESSLDGLISTVAADMKRVTEEVIATHREIYSKIGSDMAAGSQETEKALQGLSKQLKELVESFSTSVRSIEQLDASARNAANTVGTDLSEVLRKTAEQAAEVQSSLDQIHRLAIKEAKERGGVFSRLFSRRSRT